MEDTLTYVVYSLFLSGAIVPMLVPEHKKRIRKWILCLTVLLICIAVGGRYEVGTDWRNYFDFYVDVNSGVRIEGNNIEYGYWVLNYLGSQLGFSPSFFFAFVHLIIFACVMYTMKEKENLAPIVLFFFLTTIFFSSMNIMRQAIATSIFFVAMRYVKESKWRFVLLVMLATTMHTSSVVLMLPLFFIKRIYTMLELRWLALGIFILTTIFSSTLLPILIQYTPIYWMTDKYVENLNNIDFTMKISSGIGLIIRYCIDLFLIWLYPIVVRKHSDLRFKMIYCSYFWGCVLQQICGLSVFLSRLPYGLYSLRLYVLSVSTYVLFQMKRETFISLAGYAIVLLYTAMYFSAIYNGDAGVSPYQFRWI